MNRSDCRDGRTGSLGPYRTSLTILLVLAALMLLAACGGGAAGGSGEAENTGETGSSEGTAGTTSTGEETSGEVALTPTEATVSENEETAMPANNRQEDPAQAPPENPPEGVRTYPATTNGNVEGQIAYKQDPPTNGDHAPYWQKCGFYSSPIENEAAVHSMDHGAVWITYRPDLPQDQIDTLRGLAQEEYVLVSPYSSLYAPVVATAWRNQLELTGVDDPRLRQFVDQFRISETAPRSGNGCENGRGEPEVA
ncbi:MAG: DUF3105 domain-containing protein [Actinobacteria bacterium]|nr:DUF3105 domain-containing protein [Actinomycetota bacterium]